LETPDGEHGAALPPDGGRAKGRRAMVNVSIARRYARALLDVATEAGRADAVSEQLTSFSSAVGQNRELADVLFNPAYTREQRARVVESLLKALGQVETVLANSMRLLVDRNRLGYLPDIARLYRDMVDTQAGRVRGHVTSAVPLSADTLQSLAGTLKQLTQRNVVLESRVDPSVLGGVAAQVGSTLYDGTLRTQLEQLRRELKQR
jgi:F-type H+-transporting ATPase subunit delta